MLENEHTVHSVITVFPLHARRVSLQQLCHQYAGPNMMFQKQKMQLYSYAKQESPAKVPYLILSQFRWWSEKAANLT